MFSCCTKGAVNVDTGALGNMPPATEGLGLLEQFDDNLRPLPPATCNLLFWRAQPSELVLVLGRPDVKLESIADVELVVDGCKVIT